MAESPSEPFWCLHPDLILPTPAVLAVLNLERAGHRLTLDATQTQIHVEPAAGATIDPEALANLRRWKRHAIVLMRYASGTR